MSDYLKQKQSRLEELLLSFDKRYIEEIFEEIAQTKYVPIDERQNIVYDHNGYRYFIRQVDLRTIPMSQGGLKPG